jgi:hypothetical protein
MRNSEALSKSYALFFLTFLIADTFLLSYTLFGLGIYYRAVSGNMHHKMHNLVDPNDALKELVRK